MRRGFLMKKYLILFLALAVIFVPRLQTEADTAQIHKAVFVLGQKSYFSDGQTREMDAVPFIQNGRAFVPVRYLALSLGVPEDKIIWSPSAQTVTLMKDGANVVMAVGGNIIYVNGRPREIDAVPVLKDGRTYLPARYVAEGLGYEVAWDDSAQAVLIGPPGNLPEPPRDLSWTTRYEQREVETPAGIKTANLVYVNMNNPGVELKPVMAEDRVGRVEELASMAGRVGAVAAINGTFFNAYDANDLMPHGTLGAHHRYYHLGSSATLGVDGRNRVHIGRLTPHVEGGTDGSWEWPNWWYAWGINHHYSSDGIVVFTPDYKYEVTPPGRTVVLVRNGVVTGIESGQVAIPPDGYVIWYGENNSERADQFAIGK
ncbi:MAG: copper amine oxidase N-terminal domain-containing protein, partial [Peptococcaceae bacterium]|nr:copper amine oxidase N-terminal domain-containing protein [Peptococcaceae bacterium]